ncbi:MAG: sodium:alanine symporter family protein [Clostridia bacterium]|nr:sodium:alanine symporter family protein [Clostridia bacterium]
MLLSVLSKISDALWGMPMLILFIGTGVYFTVRSGFLQFRAGRWLRMTVGNLSGQKRSSKHGSISPYQALCTSLAACMGTGNITGVATALRTGGPGAIFWMCVCAVFSMMTSFVETSLGIEYRIKDSKGHWSGGAMLYIEKGLGMKKTAKLYAVSLAAASFGIGSMTQVNSAALAVEDVFGVKPIIIGLIFCLLTAATVCGGIKRISGTAEKTVPVLSVIFIAASAAALFICRENLAYAVKSIVTGAFGLDAAVGGVAGFSVRNAVRTGVSRGVFSNEAGLGSTSVIHSSAEVDSPEEQGMWGILEVFLDTVVMCSVTGLVILTSGIFEKTQTDGSVLFAQALSVSLGKAGGFVTAVTLCLLSFASVTGWYFCGEKGVLYAFGKRGIIPYRIMYTASVIIGSVSSLRFVFSVSDILNAVMAVPNLFAIILLSGPLLRRIKSDKAGNTYKVK